MLTLWVASPKIFYNWYGFNRAQTICGIAHILGILLTNSYDFLDISSDNNLPSVFFESFYCWFSVKVKFCRLNIASLLWSCWDYIYRTLSWCDVQLLSKWARPNDPPFIPMKTRAWDSALTTIPSRVTHINASQFIRYRGRRLLVWWKTFISMQENAYAY